MQMKRFKFRRAVTSVVTALMVMASFAVPMPALAQTANTGVITGVVKDSNGAVVPGATVKAINKATGVERKTTTSDSGVYELTQMVPADYRVEVEAKGFSRFAAEPVTVNVLQRTTLDPDLKPAGTAEQVTVTAEGAALVETGKTDVGGVINQKQLDSLPVNGRSFASLAVLIPGATLEPSFDPTKARTGTFSIGGSTGRNLNITVDGGDNKDNAVGGILQNFTMEGIQEFALSTQRFSAANGRSGGALLSVVTKSGSNRLSGSAFGFFRDHHYFQLAVFGFRNFGFGGGDFMLQSFIRLVSFHGAALIAVFARAVFPLLPVELELLALRDDLAVRFFRRGDVGTSAAELGFRFADTLGESFQFRVQDGDLVVNALQLNHVRNGGMHE